MTATATAPRGKTNGTRPAAELFEIPIERIIVGSNVRAAVGDVAELADSIRVHGLLQPLRVEQGAGGEGGVLYLLKIGHRRLAAARLAELTHVPAIVDQPAAQSVGARSVEQLVENLQRQDLGPLDEARALRGILDADKKLTQAELARRIGRSAPYVSNALRILELDAKVLPLVESGQLSGSHAKALAGVPKGDQRTIGQLIVSNGWSVHQVEQHVQHAHEAAEREKKKVEELAKWAEETEGLLVAQGAAKKTTTLTTRDGYGYGPTETALKAMKARGWKAKTESWARGKLCDCLAFGVSRDYHGNTQISRRCVVQAHYQEKLKAEGRRESASWEERNRQDALHRARRDRLREAVTPAFHEAFAKLPPNIARILLWSAMDYSLNDWVKEHKGDRKKPDAWGALSDRTSNELADDLIRFVLRDLDSRYNVKLDLEAIAEAFGVSIEEPPAKAKRGKAAAS